ncbi:MAG: SAM-dependent methyltransferase [Nitrospiraceae bacterium]|nr:SAM-dependent methyltransferase [Nitrospiraceae bacterium]
MPRHSSNSDKGGVTLSAGHPQLLTEITAEIAANGPIPFARFMELALYHPQFGYYVRPVEASKERIGWSGDFYTSSDVHPILGQALAKQAWQLDEALGHPNPFTVVEMGPGKGLLARDFLAACAHAPAGFRDRLRYVLIERSASMRTQQQQNLAPWLGEAGQVAWIDRLADLPQQSVTGLFFSNELVDAFPVHRLAVLDGRPQELWVDYRDGRFVETYRPMSDALSAYLRDGQISLPDGYRTEINLAALDWMTQVAQVMDRGVVLTIDYGHTADDLYGPERKQGTFLCYYSQTTTEDAFDRVGYQDMTAHVDFTALARIGARAGLEVTGFTNQMSFLIGLGMEQMLESLPPESPEFFAAIQLLRPDGMGRTFKILVQHTGMPKPELDGLKFQPFFGSILAARSAA